jgi:hypothetical protein
MEFRWIALLSLWTLLIGPVVAVPSGDGPTRAAQVQGKGKAVRTAKFAKAHKAHAVRPR